MIKTDFFFIFEKKNEIFISTRKPLRIPRTCFSVINRVLLYLLQTPRRLFIFGRVLKSDKLDGGGVNEDVFGCFIHSDEYRLNTVVFIDINLN